ncbi:glycosyl transferase family 1 [Frondihabitans sp. PhB188]|nr:glycosyl transferase family 1 [Frondihabitans sp. PhB188]
MLQLTYHTAHTTLARYARKDPVESPNWPEASVLAYPMHGTTKLLTEGYRTRDGHFIEWLGATTREGVAVVSRPEPQVLRARDRIRPKRTRGLAAGTSPVETGTWRLPHPRRRRRWWVDSADRYPRIPSAHAETPALVWNPFVATAPEHSNPFASGRPTVLDLLDDWSIHHAFESIRDEVEEAYAAAFAAATHVTANGAGTEQLARRFGRDDVILVPNGCDPERFSATSAATGALTVGYVGKIGRRLDLDGIVRTVAALPEVDFVFAGPILDAEFRPALAALPNVELLGDVHYDDVPALLTRFDLGWIPHRVGDGEVGGDVIKTYEYRAAGLPVLSTPFCSVTDRGLDEVLACDLSVHEHVIAAHASAGDRIARRPSPLPAEATWRVKNDLLLSLLGAEVAA